MKINTQQLITELILQVEQHITRTESLTSLGMNRLQQRKPEGGWNILECVEHLNLYGDFYLPEIKKRIVHARHTHTPTFQTGWLGNYFVNMMQPGAGMKKMKTFKDKDPQGKPLTTAVIDLYIQQQKELVSLLQQAMKINLGKTKTSISISSLMKLKLGDTFRFIIAHDERHLQQAENIAKALAPTANNMQTEPVLQH